MILYQVRCGVVTPMSVVRETNTGWRLHNGGFINRCRQGKYIDLREPCYTTCEIEAIQWSKDQVSYMHHAIQVSQASLSDLDFWVEGGRCEDGIPKSRWQTW